MDVRRHVSWLLPVLVLGAWQPALAQGGPRGPRGLGVGVGMELRVALRNRGELGLSDEQVKRIEELAARVEQKARPYLHEMQEVRRRVQAGEADRSWAQERMRALMEKARSETEAEIKEFRELLTKEQAGKLEALVREAQRARRRGPPPS